MKYLFRILTTPSCWIRNYPTNKQLSDKINKLIECVDTKILVHDGGYKISLGNLDLWNANYPYGSYRLYDNKGYGMPDRCTTFRLCDKINEEIFK